jgi:hypothetical protein
LTLKTTKIDRKNDQHATDLAKANGFVFMETSAKTGHNVTEVFTELGMFVRMNACLTLLSPPCGCPEHGQRPSGEAQGGRRARTVIIVPVLRRMYR